MAYLNIPYYVSLLSAATLHGTTSRDPLSFQVVCKKYIPNLQFGPYTVRFFQNKNFSAIPTQEMATPAGSVTVATLEGIAFGLIRYLPHTDHFRSLPSLLGELGKKMKGPELVRISLRAQKPYSQRLGYWLDDVCHSSLTAPLHQFLSQTKKVYIPLKPDVAKQNCQNDKKWGVIL